MKNAKTVFITGGTSGIGLALAKKYQLEGHKVGICGRNLSKLPKHTSKEILTYELDVRDRDKLIQAVRAFSAEVGGLGIIVANAGKAISNKKKLPDFEAARELIDINVIGVINTFEAALGEMSKVGNGQLVAIASVAGQVGLPGAGAYCASKAAVIKLCESYWIDLKSKGIKVTTVCPGFIDTPLTKQNGHKMPFIMSAEKAANKIFHAIEREKVIFTFPWQMNLAITFLEKIPRIIYRNLITFGTKLVMPGRSE